MRKWLVYKCNIILWQFIDVARGSTKPESTTHSLQMFNTNSMEAITIIIPRYDYCYSFFIFRWVNKVFIWFSLLLWWNFFHCFSSLNWPFSYGFHHHMAAAVAAMQKVINQFHTQSNDRIWKSICWCLWRCQFQSMRGLSNAWRERIHVFLFTKSDFVKRAMKI